MSRFGKLFRRAAVVASVAVPAGTAGAQQPTPPPPAPLNLSGQPTQEEVVPAAGIGRGPLGHRGAPNCVPCPPCLPAAPGTPVSPGTPPTTPPGTDPMQPPAAQPQQPAPNFGAFGGGADVGQSVGLSSPNLFGDILGGRPSQVFLRQTQPGFLNGKTVVIAVTGVKGAAPGTVFGNLNNASLSIRDASATNLIPLTPISIMGLPLPVTNPITARSVGIRGSFTENVPVGVNTVYTPTGVNAASANYVLQYAAGTAGGPPPGVPFTIPGIIPVGAGRDMLAAPTEKAMNPQATLQSFSLGGVQAVYDGSELRYFSTISSTISTPLVLITVPNPGTGGAVGLLKISEDNNPMPRDRVIFNYDYFDSVPFTAAGIPVNRYQFGVEKTFLDGRASLEMRLPFASTINSDMVMGATGTNTELGNLRIAPKLLLLRREKVNVSTGMGIYLPTADDFNVRQANGQNMIHVNNTSVQLAPYVAVLYTPNDRLFGQAWLGMTFDTGGNQVTVNPTVFGGTGNIGNLRAANLLTADIQVGYWVYQSDSGYVRGAAPFVELHYNGAVSNGTVLSAGQGFFVGDTGGNFDEFNLSAGVTMRIGQQGNLSVGAAAPLRTGQNRTFDYQIGVRFNYFFGYTAQRQARGTYVNSFQ